MYGSVLTAVEMEETMVLLMMVDYQKVNNHFLKAAADVRTGRTWSISCNPDKPSHNEDQEYTLGLAEWPRHPKLLGKEAKL